MPPAGIRWRCPLASGSCCRCFWRNPEIPLSRDEIAEAMDVLGEGTDPAEGRAIDMLVGRLRSKIEDAPKDPTLIRTARGVGYVLACPVEAEA